MVSDLEGQGWVQLGVSGALQQEYLKDQQFFLELLAKTLQAAIPDNTSVRTRGLFKKTLAGVTVDFGEYRYTFEKPERGPVMAMRTKVVRGIALKSEELPVDAALQELSVVLEEKAAKSESARKALAGMLGLE